MDGTGCMEFDEDRAQVSKPNNTVSSQLLFHNLDGWCLCFIFKLVV